VKSPQAAETLVRIERDVVRCRRCPRLVAWREESAAAAPRRFRGESYWARPVPAFGASGARILVVGLAPAAHGGNRTGRMFTGDRSGDFLFCELHDAGLASAALSRSRDDGLELRDVLITAAARCAPPENRPTPAELDLCRSFLAREIAALADIRVLVALGGVAHRAAVLALARAGVAAPRPRPRFAHGAEHRLGPLVLLDGYHPSQQNTFTGRLTPGMLRSVFERAVQIASGEL
jgi:uracil-DNA glycosylase family 4